MSPADIVRTASAGGGSANPSRRPQKIDLSDIPERPIGKNAERGKFARYFRVFPLVEIAPDLAGTFSSAEEVNDALRLLLRLAEQAASFASSGVPRKKTRKKSLSRKTL